MAKSVKRLGGPLDVEKALNRMNAGRVKQISKDRAALRKQLAQIDVYWFAEVMKLLGKGELKISALILSEIPEAVTNNGCAGKISEFVRCISIDGLNPNALDETLIFYFFSWIVDNDRFAAQLLEQSRSSKQVAADMKFIMYRWMKNGNNLSIVEKQSTAYDFIMSPRLVQDEKSHLPGGLEGVASTSFNWHVEKSKQGVAEGLMTEAHTVLKIEGEATVRCQEITPDWAEVDKLWKRICTGAHCGLHIDGDDLVLSHPDLLQATQVSGATIRLNGSFPGANVTFCRNIFGVEIELETPLSDGRIIDKTLDMCFSPYLQWLMTISVLTGYYNLINEEGIKKCLYKVSQNGSSQNGAEKTARDFVPHTFRLREGYKASQQAQDACIRILGRPLTSFRAPQDCAISKHKPVLKVTPELIAQTMGQ